MSFSLIYLKKASNLLFLSASIKQLLRVVQNVNKLLVQTRTLGENFIDQCPMKYIIHISY